MTFINGVRTTRKITEATTTSGLDFSVIGLIGTAPIHDIEKEDDRNINKPVLITDYEEGVKYFGKAKKGYTIPQALDAIYSRLDSAKVIVVNVFDPEKHAKPEIETEQPDKIDVSAKDIIGDVEVDGTRHGLEAFKDSVALCRVKPRILIAPEFSTKDEVRTALDKLAGTFKAHVYCDVEADNVKGAITTRNEDISSKNIELVYPKVKAYNSETGQYEYRAASSYAAATRVYTDSIHGLHYSIGNQVVKGIEGTEVPIYFDIQDENSDSNLLNSQGITTIIYDEGYRFWGNRNSTYPDNENIDSFSNEERIANYIDESIATKSRQFMSGPITTAMIDDVVNFGKNFLGNLKLKGWLIGGDCWYNEKKNTYQSLASGKMVITRKFLAPVPLEDLEYESELDITLYSDIYNESEV